MERETAGNEAKADVHSYVNTVVGASSKCKIVIAYVHVDLKQLPVKYLLNIFTTDCQPHTASS